MSEDRPTGCVEVHLRAIDTHVVVELSGTGAADLERLVRRAWSRCLIEPAGGADVTIGVEFDADADPLPVVDRLSPQVTMAAIEHQAGRLVMLHAAGLADPVSGRTVGLVAPSGTGKTTSSRLLAHTWGYVSDETLAIRADDTIALYPKPLSVRVDGALYKDQLPVDDLVAAPERCVLAGLALLARDGSAQAWVEKVSTVRALAALAPESSYLARVPRPLHRLAELVETAGGLRIVHYSEAEQLPPVVATLIREE